MRVPTVKIVHEDSYIIINESDFDKSNHELYVEDSSILSEMSFEEIDKMYSIEELKGVAKSLKMRSYVELEKDVLIERIMNKVTE